ncbi:hypothetical protein [Paenalkalicoccus suaedae]|nr:hypothetical protein [Paenalkalicoccus suaedae]
MYFERSNAQIMRSKTEVAGTNAERSRNSPEVGESKSQKKRKVTKKSGF